MISIKKPNKLQDLKLIRNFDTISMWITKTKPLKEKLHRDKDYTLDLCELWRISNLKESSYTFEKNNVLKRLTDSCNRCLGYIFRSSNLQELIKKFCVHLLLTSFPTDGQFSIHLL